MAALKLYLRRTTDNSASGPSAEQSTNLPNGSVSSPTFAKRDLDVALGSVQAAETLVHTHPNESGVHRDGMMRMFVSDALAAVTIAAGTWRVGLSHAESNGAADTYNNITVYIWRPGTSSKVGTIYDAHDGTGFGNELTDGRQIVSFSGGSVTCQAGDRIVFEWWHHWQHTMASAYTSTIRYDDGTELDDINAREGSWIECPQDDIFGAAGTTLTPDLLTHTRATYSPTVSPQLRPARLDHTRSILAPVVSVGATLTPGLLTHTRAIYAPTVSPQLRLARLDHTRAVYALDLDVTVKPALLTHTRAILAPQVNVTVKPDRLDHTRAVYAPTVSGALTLLPDRLDHTRAIYAPTVSPQLRPARLDHGRSTFAPTVSPQLRPARLDHTRAVYSPNVVVSILPARLDHTRSTYAPTVSPQVRPARLDHARAVYEPGIPAPPGAVGADISTRTLPLQP